MYEVENSTGKKAGDKRGQNRERKKRKGLNEKREVEVERGK